MRAEKFECDAEKTAHMKYPYHGCTSNTTISVNFMLFLLNVVKKCFVEETLKKLFCIRNSDIKVVTRLICILCI